MRRIALLTSILLCFAVASPAQSLQQYLTLRKKYGISQAVGIEAMETFVGKRTMEVQGVVKGSLTVSGKTVLLVERTDGESLTVQTDAVPDWLSGNQVRARLLVHAERLEEFAPLEAYLIAASSETSIASIEAEAKRKAAAAAAARAKKNPPKPSGSIPSRFKGKAINWNLPVSEATPYYAGFIKGRNKRLTNAQAYEIAEGIIGFSIRYGIDARLILAMVLVESGFNPNATSRAGAQGLGQLMPGTAAGMGISDSYDTKQNLYGTVRKVRGHMERYYGKTGDAFEALVLTLAAYNAGSGAVRRNNFRVPPYRETQNYINKVLSVYYRFIGAK